MQEYEILQAIYLLRKIRGNYITKSKNVDHNILLNIDNAISDINFIKDTIQNNWLDVKE